MKKKTIDKKKRKIIIFVVLGIILLLVVIYPKLVKYHATKACNAKYENAKTVKIEGDYYCCTEIDNQFGCWRVRYGKEK